MAKKDYTPAEAVKLLIGDLEFDAIRILETGEYRMSQSQALKAIGHASRYLSEFESKTPSKAQKLASKGFTWVRVTVKYHDGKQNRYSETISLEDVFVLWRFEDKQQNVKAEIILDALGIDSLRDRFDQVFGKGRTTAEERRRQDSRVMQKACPWDLMFQPELCKKIQRWYGFDCNKFYWWYCYNFLQPQERADIEKYNPVIQVTSKSGATRTLRRARIHQYLSQETRDRLHDFAEYLWKCIDFCDSRTEFEKKWSQKYGQPTQLEIFDLWEFAK